MILVNRLQTKILLILVIVLSTTISVNYLLSSRMLKTEFAKTAKSEFTAIGYGLKIQVERLLSYGLTLDDIVGFDDICKEVVQKYDGVAFAAVVDTNGVVLFHDNVEKKNNVINVPEIIAALKNREDLVIDYKIQDKDYFGFVTPIIGTDRSYLGAVVLGFPLQGLAERVAVLSRTTAIMSFGLLIVAIGLISLALLRWITRPILQLSNFTKKIAHSGTDDIEFVNISSTDEIGQLATSFNEMTARLKKTTVSKEYLDNIITSMTDSLIAVNSKYQIESVNEAALSTLGYSHDELIGIPIDAIFYDTLFQDNLSEVLIKTGQQKNYETVFKTKNGKRIPVLLSCSVVQSDSNSFKYIVCTAKDITEMKRAEQIMYAQANYDALTGLANRYLFERQVREAIEEIGCHGNKHVLLYLDLDDFKVVNDTCGHVVGDRVLREIAVLIKRMFHDTDIIARLGGDEFAILLENTTLSAGVSIANRLCDEISKFRFIWSEMPFTFGVSIGIVELSQKNQIYEAALSAADRACYLAKEKGRNRVYIFAKDDPQLTEQHDEMQWLPKLIKAMEDDRFFLVYQEIVPAATNFDHNWFEVLIRLIDEKNGNVISPGVFLPAAQRFNMMNAIDRWVINKFAKTYQDIVSELSDDEKPLFNINISGASLSNATFLDFVCEKLERYCIPPESICFEITETTAVSNFEGASKFINKLKSLGCKFALDDFGSGLSSFGYLKNLHVNYLKIDGELVRNIVNSQVDYAMVSSINDLAHVLNIETIAEFVEHQRIFQTLQQIGVDYAQGYWIGKPRILKKISRKTKIPAG